MEQWATYDLLIRKLRDLIFVACLFSLKSIILVRHPKFPSCNQLQIITLSRLSPGAHLKVSRLHTEVMACADPKWADNWGDLLPRVSWVVGDSLFQKRTKTWYKLLSFATKALPHSPSFLRETWTGN